MKNVYVFDHPLIKHKITKLCDKTTTSKDFSTIVSEIATLMAYEVLRDLKTKNVMIDAPISSFESPVLDENFTIVPILRAGLGMVDGIRSLYPKARVGHIGLYRDEETLEPHTYYFKLPKDVANGPVLIVDPALATGGSAAAAVKYIKDAGCKDIRLLCLIGAKEGIHRVVDQNPDVKVYVAKYEDAPLNEKGYIVTAFGDAGDRIMGTF
ncbi:MAG: uracil phosphoribosyltransferase [Christensenella sp.]|nr:uracil phosphoribosyltransferase [Christensenella sp.]